MNRTRLIAIAKLILLFGAPLALLLGLFGSGVYCGVQNRASITQFERDWLGLDVEVPESADQDAADDESTANGSDDESPESKPAETEKDDSSTSETPESKPAETKAAEVTPTPAPAPTQPPPGPSGGVGALPAPLPAAVTRVDPLSADAQAKLEAASVVRVQVWVDDSYVKGRSNWIDQVQRTITSASSIYQEQFGIRLELWAVSRWPVPLEGMGKDELVADLRDRPSAGAQVTLGFTDRMPDGNVTMQALPDNAPTNAGVAVVYAVPGHRQAHLRSLLHELAALYGAVPIVDPDSAAWKAGSWMGFLPVSEDQPVWIDADNRRRVLDRKALPFSRSSQAPTEPAAAPTPEPSNEEATP